ncbi:MAG: hypothetical protein LC643_03660 [Bacteroidales bacterium]|nr:hypothetical protein [Bacteroidales bacterium]
MFDCPECDLHKKEHDSLRHKLAEIIGSLDIEDMDYEDLERFVEDWLKSHTSLTDAKITAFLKAQFEQ